MFKQNKLLIFTIFIIMIGMSNIPIMGQKLIPGEEWQYEAGATLYNESATETIQIRSGETAIATTVVNTNRPIENNYKYSKVINGGSVMNVSLTLDLQETLGVLWITQAGGFPINSHAIFSGSGVLIVQTSKYGIVNANRSFSNAVMQDNFNGNPALALTTAESQTFGFTRLLGNPGSGNDYLVFGRQYVISTDQSASDPIRNYTVTPTFLSLEVRIGDNTFILNKSPTETMFEISTSDITEQLFRSPSLPQAQLYQYDETNRLPLLIRQTQSAKIGALSLNAFEDTENPTEVVEYRLVNDRTSSGALSTEDDSPLIIFISSIVLIIFYRTYKKRRY